MLKINDNLDEHSLKILMILNASATPPLDSPANSPTEFYANFLQRKSQFKAKELITHRLMLEKISFYPRVSFVTCLWNADFFWILPDSPSGSVSFVTCLWNANFFWIFQTHHPDQYFLLP